MILVIIEFFCGGWSGLLLDEEVGTCKDVFLVEAKVVSRSGGRAIVRIYF